MRLTSVVLDSFQASDISWVGGKGAQRISVLSRSWDELNSIKVVSTTLHKINVFSSLLVTNENGYLQFLYGGEINRYYHRMLARIQTFCTKMFV